MQKFEHQRRLLLQAGLGAIGLAGAAVSTKARAAGFPERPITLVVPYVAGGPTDVTARRFAEAMAPLLGATMVIENRPGAATNLAATYVSRAPKDGHTLLLAPGTMTSVNPLIYKSPGYQTTDFAPISLISQQAFVLTASNSFPARDLNSFIALAKSKPGSVTIGHVGTGSVTHIVGEWIARALGIQMLAVPYKGSAQSTLDLLGGRIDTQIEGITAAVPMHQAGKARILVSMGQERANLPAGVPTFKEAGFPELFGYAYFGLMAPIGTPEPVLRQLHQAARQAAGSPAFVEHLARNGELASPSDSREAYAQHLRREAERWAPIVRPLNVQLD